LKDYKIAGIGARYYAAVAIFTLTALLLLPFFGVSPPMSITQSGIEMTVLIVLAVFIGIVTFLRRVARALRKLLAK
jgi:protein-S-isoprenylcysteine O-methyltransferase Ste14